MLILLLISLHIQYYVPLYNCLSITGDGKELYVLTEYGIGHLKDGKYVDGIPKNNRYHGADLIFYQQNRGIWLLRKDSLFLYNPFLKVEIFRYKLPFKPTSFSVKRDNIFLEKDNKTYLYNYIENKLEQKKCIECQWTGKLSLKGLKKQGIPSTIVDPYAKVYKITSLYFDYENAWAGTNGNGLLKYSIFNRIPDTIQIGAYDITYIENYKNYMIFSGENLIFIMKEGEWRRYKNTGTLPMELSDILNRLNELKNYGIDSTYIGDMLLWIKKGGLHIIDSNGEKFLKGIEKFFSDGKEIILLGHNGVYKYDKEPVRLNFPFSPEDINYCFIKEGTFFFGTKKGIVKIKKNDIVRIYNVNDGLPSNNILSLYVKNNKIWFSSDRGVGYIVE